MNGRTGRRRAADGRARTGARSFDVFYTYDVRIRTGMVKHALQSGGLNMEMSLMRNVLRAYSLYEDIKRCIHVCLNPAGRPKPLRFVRVCRANVPTTRSERFPWPTSHECRYITGVRFIFFPRERRRALNSRVKIKRDGFDSNVSGSRAERPHNKRIPLPQSQHPFDTDGDGDGGGRNDVVPSCVVTAATIVVAASVVYVIHARVHYSSTTAAAF